jgi:hypothetical protein
VIGTEQIYELCDLLEFWPDNDPRLKFRGRVLIRPTAKLLEKYAGVPGIAYDEDWMEMREIDLHEEDRQNLILHCARKLDGAALILHQARPSLNNENDEEEPERGHE